MDACGDWAAARRRAAAAALGLVAVTLACLGLLLFTMQRERAGGLGQPQPEAVTPLAGEWYELYFTRPAASEDLPAYGGGLDEPLADAIAAARRSVDVAVYEFDQAQIAEALVAAHNRGVALRVVTDSDSVYQTGPVLVEAAGIPVVDDGRSALMHNKFMVIDESVVWTGSLNFTQNDVYRNDNNLLRLTSPHLAANFTAEFEEMFNAGQFGATSPQAMPYPQLYLGGSLVETHFAAENEIDLRLIEIIRSARERIEFMAFTFTHGEIGRAIIGRAGAGVPVRGVFDRGQAEGCCPEVYRAMREAGLDVRLDGNPYRLHHKVIMVDGRIVITGSYNFSIAAERANDETVLILHNADLATGYRQEFERVWQLAGG